jgi:hypothetical protein
MQWHKAGWPILTFVQNHLVAEDNDIEFAVVDKAVQDVSARLTSSLDIESADSNDAPRSRLCWNRDRVRYAPGAA